MGIDKKSSGVLGNVSLAQAIVTMQEMFADVVGAVTPETLYRYARTCLGKAAVDGKSIGILVNTQKNLILILILILILL